MCRRQLLCVTNRSLCRGDFLRRIESAAAGGVGGILLREKDLSEGEYRVLARQVLPLCAQYQTPCILHSFVSVARALHAGAFHAPLRILRGMTLTERRNFSLLGASCHGAEEAREAQALGCTYITAGHIFDTDSKKGLPGRGLDFLEEVCRAVSIPVYAIGGIKGESVPAVIRAGAAGACVMGDFMTCPDVAAWLKSFEKEGEYAHCRRDPAPIRGDRPGLGGKTDPAGTD